MLTNSESPESSRVFMFSAAIATQGFKLENAEIAPDSAIFTIRDLSANPDNGRIAHCSQFLAVARSYFEKDHVQIEYTDSSGAIVANMEASGHDIDQALKDPVDWQALAGCVRYSFQKS